MAEQASHRLNVRDRPAFLRRMMDELAGQARMSLEGDLARCKFADDVVLACEEMGIFRRNTLWPRQDFVVLRLEPETTAPLLKQILAAGLSRAIIHVQIERAGVLQLGAYDNFQDVITGPGVTAAPLAALRSTGVVRDFAVAEAGARSPRRQ
jgi:hypothetical protein